MHDAACKPFLEYFSSTDRLVSIDVASGAEEPIWDKVHGFFTGLQLQAWRPVNSILVFAMGELKYTIYYSPHTHTCTHTRTHIQMV